MQLLEEWEDVPSVGPALAAMFVHSGLYIDDVVQMRRWNESEEAFEDFYYHSDDLSSVRALSDSGGELVELYDYHEYGLPTITDPNTIVSGRPALLASSAFGNPFLFTGQMYDAETRLYHYRTRPYEPRMGRFISIDSIGVWGDGANLGNGYAYVGNMPADWVDPWGLAPDTDWFNPRISYPYTWFGPPTSPNLSDPRNDPMKGCGITVRRAPGKFPDIGHDWIEIDDPSGPDPRRPDSTGFWPVDPDPPLLWDVPSEVFRPDPYEGSPPSQVWDTFPKKESIPIRSSEPFWTPKWQDVPATIGDTPVTDSTCERIRDCIRRATVNKNYNLPTFNCRHGADEILRQCGLTRHEKDRYGGPQKHYSPVPMHYR